MTDFINVYLWYSFHKFWLTLPQVITVFPYFFTFRGLYFFQKGKAPNFLRGEFPLGPQDSGP